MVVIGPLVVDNGLHTGTRPVRTVRSEQRRIERS